MDRSPIRDPTVKKELLKELYRLNDLREEWEAKNRGAQATVILAPSYPHRLKADMTVAILRMIDGFIAAIEFELAAFEAPAHAHRAQSSAPIPLGPPASKELVPVVAAASASGPRELPSGSTRRGAPAPNPIPRASGTRRNDPMTIPFVGWTIHRPSLKAIIAAALIVGAGLIIAIGWALIFGPLRGPTIDTSKAPATTTGTPGGGSGGVANGGVIIDLDTCTVKNEDGSTSTIENCTPADAFPSRMPASPNENLNIVDQPGECGVIHDYPLTDLPEVATSGNYIVVENYDLDVASDPEVESVLEHGRYAVVGNLDGYVWEYSVECSLDEVMAFAQTQIDNRLKDGQNNGGFASQETTDARFSLINNQAPFWGHFDPNRANPDAPACQVMDEYPLAGHDQLSTKGSYIHVEHYVGGEPERESILAGGNVKTRVHGGAKGFVWEYSKNCSWNQVREEIRRHIQRRRADSANNAGFITWDDPALNGRFTR